VQVRSVLVVDDNAALRKAICELFTRNRDFEVCGEAENGEQAIERACVLHPALIVTDLSMPRMNGLDATRTLKKLMPCVPVILYSIHVDTAVTKAALSAGVSAVVSKGTAATTLISTARELLDHLAA
jgi:DNA-binding NarL/FixJ family response regulator